MEFRRQIDRPIWKALSAAALVLLQLYAFRNAAASDFGTPLLPSIRDFVSERTDGRVSSYALDLRLDPESGTLSGTQRVSFVNTTGQVQTKIPFRLYPNAGYYGEGALQVERVRVKGALVTPAYAAEETVMTVPLPEPLPPDGQTSIALRYTVTVPADSSGTYGIFSRDIERGTWILADWYPILAGWEPGTGWRLDPPSIYGDPTFSETALYDLSLTMPAGWEVAASGIERAGAERNGETGWQIVSGPARELTLVIDDDFATTSRVVDGTEITFFTEGDGNAEAGAAIAFDTAAEVLPVYSGAFGAYPYTELDLVETEMAGALGVSWSGIVFLNGAQLLANSSYAEQEPERLAFTVSHEIGHQWWGAVVGVNSNDHTFLLEGLTNYLSVVAIERTAGQSAADRQLLAQCVQPYLNALEQYGDGIADLPISVVRDGPPLGALTYGKAALGFLAIRQTVGDEAFFSALQRWADEFAFGIAEPDDLLEAFEATSNQELGDLWTFWFLSAETTPADVQALIEV